MTAYAPPSYSYFSGLQFNPNINEQSKTAIGQRLYGGLVSIIGTISTIITTPLFKIIQGATTTLNMIEASTDFMNTNYFQIQINGNSLLYLTTAFTNLLNGTEINIGTPNLNLATYGTGNYNMNFLTSIANPTVNSAQIIVSGGTATANAGTMEIDVATMNNNAVIHNINSSTLNVGVAGGQTNISGTTLNMSSTTTAFPNNTSLTFFSTNGGYPFYDSGNRYILVSSATTISNFTTTFDTIFVVPYTNGTTFQISLAGAAGNVNSGNSFRIFNNGSAAITIATSNSTSRLVGAPIARAGASSYSLASNASVRIQTLIPSGSPFNQTAANSGSYFLSLC